MTVYVDDARIPAQVGRVSGRWSHLTADSPGELHAFAERIGLRRAWFQPGRPSGGKPSIGWHYDVTDSKRAAAVAAGAQPVDIRGMGDLLRARRAALASARGAEGPDAGATGARPRSKP